MSSSRFLVRRRHLAALGAGALAASITLRSSASRADEAPSPEERVRIEAALRQMGFVSWGEIERDEDSGAWEVEDARLGNGTKVELKLSAGDLRVIKQEHD